MPRIKCPKCVQLLALCLTLSSMIRQPAFAKHHIIKLGLPFLTRLIIGTVDPGVTNPRDGQVYHGFCQVWPDVAPAGGSVEYAQRFDVHVQSAAQLPLAERTGRLLALIYGEERTRLGWDHPFEKTVHVWLTPGADPDGPADVGGQQFRNQIYIYDVYASRSPEEWLREITHEYGHYALPGVTGFTSPEAWANGFLGQRLFVYWLIEDEINGRISPQDIPFVTPAQLLDYQAREIDPPISTIEDCHGSPASLLHLQNYKGMKAYIGLVLYCDKLLGDGMLLNTFADTLPAAGTQATAPIYLQAFQRALTSANRFTLQGITASGTPTAVFLPHGLWNVETSKSVSMPKFAPMGRGMHQYGKKLRVIRSGWYSVRVTSPIPASASLKFTRMARGGVK